MAELSNGGSAVAATMSDASTRPLAAASPTSSAGIGPSRDATRARCSSTDVMARPLHQVTSITTYGRLPGLREGALVSCPTRRLALGTGEC